MLIQHRYTNTNKFADAWRENSITGLAECKTSQSLLTADPTTIWIGDRALPIVRRNQANNITVRIRSRFICIGQTGVDVINRACVQPAKYSYTPGKPPGTVPVKVQDSPEIIPRPFVRVNDCRPADLITCDLATLQQYVWASAEGPLLTLISRYSTSTEPSFVERLNSAWDEEVRSLTWAGLSVPKDLMVALKTAKATARLTQ